MPYEHQEFPKWMYHATSKPVIVHDPLEEDALGAGWSSAPVDAEAPTEVPTEAPARPRGKK